LDEDVAKKLEEMAKNVDKQNRIKDEARKKEEDEKARRDEEHKKQKEDLLHEIKKELDEFEPKLLPLRRRLLDPQKFSIAWNTQFSIVATEDKRIEIFASGRLNGNPSIYDLAKEPKWQPYILDLLRSFLIRLKQFEKYYADNVEKYIK
jgi:hypothetical protein